MAVPSKLKTWEFSLNNQIAPNASVGASGTGSVDRRELMFTLKSRMINSGIFTVPWVVQSSSNGSVADASDNWASSTDVEWGLDGNDRSWIVLHNSGMGIYMLIDLQNNTGDNGVKIDLYVSQNPYVGGATDAKPTTTQEMHLIDLSNPNSTQNSWGTGNKSGAHGFILNVMASTDGEAFKVIILYNNAILGFWQFEKPLSAPANWEGCITALFSSQVDTGVLLSTDDVLDGTDYGSVCAYFPTRATETAGLITTKAQVSFELGSRQQNTPNLDPARHPVHPLTGNPVVYRMNWLSETPAARSKLGEVVDCWILNTASVTHGDTAPVAQPDYFICGPFVVPWDGVTAPLLS
jgi:hypothetical protein